MKSVQAIVAMALVLCSAGAWAGNAEPSGVKATLKADEKVVHADKEALDAAEVTAGLPETFPPHAHHEPKPASQKPAEPHRPQTPGERISHGIEHVDKELAKVAKLLEQTNLPAAVTSAAQTLTTDLNKLKTDLTSAETTVAGK